MTMSIAFLCLICYVVLIGSVVSLRTPTTRNRQVELLPAGRNPEIAIKSKCSLTRVLCKAQGDDVQAVERYGRFGVLAPLAGFVDKSTDGWGLSYANLEPFDERTSEGALFLATNAFYLFAGWSAWRGGEGLYGFIIEVAGIASLNYHYNQLHYGPEQVEVKRALLVDYLAAILAINSTIYELFVFLNRVGVPMTPDGLFISIKAAVTALISGTILSGTFPAVSVLLAVASVSCLLMSWQIERGRPYMLFHGMWHVLSALCVMTVVK